MREKYWEFYTRTRFELNYFTQYLNDSYKWQRLIDTFLAVASCGSIAVWAVWNVVPVLWSVIIAASQVMTAVREYLPYAKRIHALTGLNPRFEAVVARIDREWFRVDRGELDDEKTNELIYSFRRECADLSNKYLIGVYFPEREDLKKAAQEDAECFFDCY